MADGRRTTRSPPPRHASRIFSVCGSYEHIPEGELLILDDSAFKERKRREEKRKPLGGIQERKHYSEPKGGGGSERKQRTQGGMGGWESTQLFCNSLGPRILLLLSRTGFQLFPGSFVYDVAFDVRADFVNFELERTQPAGPSPNLETERTAPAAEGANCGNERTFVNSVRT